MLLYISVCLRTHQDTISYSFIYIVQNWNWKLGTGTETVGLRNYGILRNYGPGLWYSEIIPKLLRNYSETGEPWNSEIMDRDHGTQKLWDSETMVCYSLLLVLVYWSVSQDPPPQAD